ncbi:MAG TPA: hypothetical protein VH988_13190, partial [Thermoanaerobaculia bacterium]|nr:hypothetical protein [Thermoanaerobaculia bacterium]
MAKTIQSPMSPFIAAFLGLAAGLMTIHSGAHAASVPAAVPLHHTPLTSVSAVTDIDSQPDSDDPGAGGGFDTETYFSETLVSKIEECTDRVEAEIVTWSRSRGLTLPKKEKSPRSLLIHAAKPGSDGFFQFSYSVDAKHARARATLYYYSNDGAQHEPLESLRGNFSCSRVKFTRRVSL